MATDSVTKLQAHLHTLHPPQRAFVENKAKRKVARAGRRGGKTVGAAEMAVQSFLDGHRVLYATPTAEQMGRFWYEVKWSLQEAIDAGVYRVNETEHFIEQTGTLNRIKAKTAWNADTLRGDFADLLILDEHQLMDEDTWGVVGMPMLADNNGDAVFIYTPPSLRSAGVSKARDPRHAAKLFETAQKDKTGLWATFHWTSYDNPNISQEALKLMAVDMSREAYRQEILAEDNDADMALLVLSMFDERTQLIDPIPLPKEWLRHTGHDFGASNPACLFIAQDPNNNLYLYDEYLPGPGRTTYQHVEEFKRRTQGLYVVKRIGGNLTSEDEIRQGYGAHGWPISAPKWKKPEQYQKLFGICERNRLSIFRNCVNVLDEVRNCLWETDSDGVRLDKVRDEARYHLISCLRSLASDFTPETVVKQGVRKQLKYTYA